MAHILYDTSKAIIVGIINMVFESIAGIVLNKFLEKFFFGISSENIKFSLLDGKFTLSNIGIQPSLITNLNLPIELRYSYIERVEIHAPWREQQMTVTINMSNIYVLVSDAGDNFDARNIFMKGKEAAIEAALKEFKSNLQRQNKKEYGYFQRLLLNWLDNINIKIECIHFRYENKRKNYSFGIKINEVSAKTVNQEGQHVFFNRSQTNEQYVRYVLEMDFMGFYFNSKEDYFLCNKTSAEITDEFNRMSNISAQNLENLDYEENIDTFNYIVTISLKTHLNKNIKVLESLNESKDGKYLFQCEINLNKIECKVTHQQYYDILDLVSVFSEYQKTYQQYANQHHFLNFREKRAKDIAQLLQKKRKKSNVAKKQQQMLTIQCQRYLTWIFKHAYEEILKRKFIKQAIKKQITLQNLKNNKAIMRIMQKIQNDKLKYWVLLSLYFRKKYQEKVSVLFRVSNDRMEQFADKYIAQPEYFELYEYEEQINRMRETSSGQFQVFLKLNVNIQQFTFEISKESVFGVCFNIDKLKSSLIVREKNYQIKLSMEDFQANVFNCKKSQKFKTYVPIIRRNVVYDGSTELLSINYERNPQGKPFIFAEIDLQFESIEITIYPEAFKHFYQILLGVKESEKSKPKAKGKKQRERLGQNVDQSMVRQFKYQKTIIKGKVKSPWVVVPLSTNNDMKKECWVVRLGDFFISPQEKSEQKVELKSFHNQEQKEEELYYEKYKLQLKKFQLRYFSSINFFHNWLKFNENQKSLYKIKCFQKEKIITMIQPFSCFVDVSMQRANLPDSIREKKHKFISRISIDEIKIIISKFLLTKMKYRLDIFGQNKEQLCEFIETNVSNIREQNDLSQYCKVSYDKLKKVNFYCILKDNFMYFFLNETYHKYHFFVDLTQVAIRIVSNEIEHFNQDKNKLVVFYLGDRQRHQNWRKKIIHLLNRKNRKIETLVSSFKRNSQDAVIEESSSSKGNLQLIVLQSRQSLKDEKEQEENSANNSSSMKLSMTFLMNKLSICLLDQKDEAFLDCMFKKATFGYEVLRTKEMHFALNQWIVNQTNKKEVFVSSNSFFEEERQHDQNSSLTNFLEIKFIYNEITTQLESIVIDVDKLFLAWKVELFTKILLYFFYDQQVGDAPSPVNFDKKRLQIIIRFQQMTFYAFFDEQLIALGKLHFITLRYYQDSIEQSYDFKCKIFQMDKYVGGDRSKRLPMIKRKHNPDLNEINYNNIDLFYVLRKKETKQIANIERLKKKLGDDILVSQIYCDWKDSIIYFENQMTFRLLNYILNKILGTVASKFKKREYSPNYIFSSMNLRKVTAFDVKLKDFQFRMPPHERGFREFALEVSQMRVSKNLDDLFLPNEIQVPTIRQPLKFLWESMMFSITNVHLNYKVGQQPPICLHQNPFDIKFIYSKLNFQREYFVILKHHDDIDRSATIDLAIDSPVIVDAHKIMFVTFLQLFYQNIKQKDGLAQKFEPSLPFPSLREYKLYLRKVGFNMCHYNEQTSKMEPFSTNTVQGLKIQYKQIGSQSTITISGQSIASEGQLPIYPLDHSKKKFSLAMESQEGEMKVVIKAEHYALEVNLDNLNNIIEFINYDNDYVSNKLMPKKPSSWQYVNVFAKNCQVRLGDLYGGGEFYISYLKGMKNDIDREALRYLLIEEDFKRLERDPSALNWEDLTDKEIKVNGENLRLSIKGDPIGTVSNLCFNRQEVTCKSSNRKHKRQKVQLGQGNLFIQLVDLTTIWSVYNSHIKKNSNFVLKTFYEPWDKLAPKDKTIQKRATEVEIEQISISLIPNLDIQRLIYLRIDLAFPSILYRTYLDEQEVQVNIRVSFFHSKEKMKQVQIGGCRLFKLKYLSYKSRKQKSIEIQSAKHIRFLLHQTNNDIIAYLMEQAKMLKTTQRKCIRFNSTTKQPINYQITLVNQTNKSIELSISSKIKINCLPGQSRNCQGQIRQIFELLNSSNSFIEVTEENKKTIRKQNTDINLYQTTSFGDNLLIILPSIAKTTFIYRSPYKLVNRTSGIVVIRNDRRFLKNQEEISLIPRSNLIEFDIRVGEWSKSCTIDVRKDTQLFGQDCFVTTADRKLADTVIVLSDRYSLKNVLPVPIIARGKQIGVNGQLSLGYLNPNEKNRFPVEFDEYIVLINLEKKQNKIEFEQKLLQQGKKRQYQLAKCQARLEYSNRDNCLVIGLYSECGLKNQSERQVIFGWGEGQFVLGSKQSMILPGNISALKFYEEQSVLSAPNNYKEKPFFSEYRQFSTVTKLQGKASILKIQPRYSLLNNSQEIIEILTITSAFHKINPYQIFQLNAQYISAQAITLLFGRYHKKTFSLQLVGINFIQMEQLYFRISIFKREEALTIMVEQSERSHTIVNKLNDITITAITSEEPRKLAKSSYRSIKQSRTDDVISKLIKPKEQAEIGLVNWNFQTIQLQFYYDAKNIEFKQIYTVDFQNMGHQFSVKHLLHEQKNASLIFALILTFERNSQGNYTITAYKQKDYESTALQRTNIGVHEVSCSLAFSSNPNNEVTIQVFKMNLIRQKGVEIQDIDLQIEKLLIREGKNTSIMSALNQEKFLNCQLILNKTLRGTCINNLIVKVTPFEIICRERSIFMILQKIVEVRAATAKKKNKLKKDLPQERELREEPSLKGQVSFQKSLQLKGQLSDLHNGFSVMKSQRVNEEGKLVLNKEWQKQWDKLAKGQKIMIVNNLESSETSIFISYTKEQYRSFDQSAINDPIIKYMLVIPPISELKLAIPHLKINDFQGDFKAFSKELIRRLRQSIGATIMSSFSSLPLFDSPIIAADGIFKYIEGMLSIQ